MENAKVKIEIKEKEKIDKYQELARELSRLWKVKKTVIPVVKGALGPITIE